LAAVVVTIITFDILQNHFINGQVNLVVMALLVLFFESSRRNEEFKASLFLSMAIAIKLVPMIFVGYLIFRKKIKSIVYVALITPSLMLLPAIVTGKKIIAYYQSYLHGFILDRVGIAGGLNTSHIEYSLQYFLRKILQHKHESFLIMLFAAFMVCIPIAWQEIEAWKKKDTENNIWIFALYLIAIPLISPMSEKHHLVYLIPILWLSSIALLHRKTQYFSTKVTLLCMAFVFLTIGKVFQQNELYFIFLCLSYGLAIFMSRDDERMRKG